MNFIIEFVLIRLYSSLFPVDTIIITVIIFAIECSVAPYWENKLNKLREKNLRWPKWTWFAVI